MATTAEALAQTAAAPPLVDEPASARPASTDVLNPWIATQSTNVVRHAAALRPFRSDEFGTGAVAPTAGHLEAVNGLITGLRRGLLNYSRAVTKAAKTAQAEPSPLRLAELVNRKDRA